MKPGYEPKTPLAALGWLDEECGEVAKCIGKIMRFGLHNINPDSLGDSMQETNIAALRREVNDAELAISYFKHFLTTVPGFAAPNPPTGKFESPEAEFLALARRAGHY